MNLEAVKMEAVMRLGASATKEQKRAAEKLALGIYAATTAMNNFNSLQAQVSPVFALEQQHQKQLQMIEEYKTLYPQSIAEAKLFVQQSKNNTDRKGLRHSGMSGSNQVKLRICLVQLLKL